MSVSSVDISKGNKLLNLLCSKLEIAAVFLLFIGFFDANLFELRARFYTASYGILLFLIILRWKRCIYAATRDLSLLFLIGMVVLSYFWSAVPEYTSLESKSVVRATLFGVYLAAQYNPKELMSLLTKLLGVAVVINLLFAGFAPNIVITQLNDEPSWRGFLTHKQYLGRMMLHSSILFLLGIFSNKKLRWIMWVGFSLSFILLFLSKSKTSWITFTIALTLLPILKFTRWQYKARTIIYILSVLIAGSIAVIVFGNLETIVVDVLHKPADFNGRFEIWQAAIESGLKRPLLGYGFSGFWTSNEGIAIVNSTWAVTNVGDTARFHSHNGFIDIFLQLGFIGTSLFLFNFFAALKRIINLLHITRTIESFWMLEFLVISLLFQFTETLTMISLNTICSIYVSIVISTIMWQDRIKRGVA